MPKPKPSPEIVRKVEEKLEARVEYFIGDTIYDIETGKAAKVKTVAVLSGAGKIKELAEKNPTMIIESIAILPDILEGRL